MNEASAKLTRISQTKGTERLINQFYMQNPPLLAFTYILLSRRHHQLEDIYVSLYGKYLRV